jgi:DNA-binding MarR family transcriptional regulator
MNASSVNAARQPSSKSIAIQRPSETAANQAALLLDSQLCFALYSTSLAMTRLYRPFLAGIGLTYPQYVVMLALWECAGPTVTELGDRVSLDSGTLTPMLKRLETLKLIQRTRSTVDERRVHITLTAKGTRLREQAEVIHERIACATECSGAQRREMTRSLQRLRASLLANASR